MSEKWEGEERRSSEVNINALLALVESALDSRFQGQKDYQDLKFSSLDKKIDMMSNEYKCSETETKKKIDELEEYVIIRQDKFESRVSAEMKDTREEILGKVDSLEKDISEVSARVGVLEEVDAHKAKATIDNIKGKIFEYIITAGIIGVVYFFVHLLTTGKAFGN